MSVLVVGSRFLDSLRIGGLPLPPWLPDELANDGAWETPLLYAEEVAKAYLDSLADVSARRFEALIVEVSGAHVSDDQMVLLRHVVSACEGNWQMDSRQRLLFRAAFEKLVGGDEQFDRLARIGRSTENGSKDLENETNAFIVAALRRRRRPPIYESALDRGAGRHATIGLANLVGEADPEAVRREILLPIERAIGGGSVTLQFQSDLEHHSASRLSTERSLLLSLALLSSRVNARLVASDNSSVTGQLDRAGLDLFLSEGAPDSARSPIQQRLSMEEELAEVWRGQDGDASDMIVRGNRFVMPNPHIVPSDRLQFFQKTIAKWTHDRARSLLQREPSPEVLLLLRGAAEAGAELVKNIAEHAEVQPAADRHQDGVTIDSFLEIFFTRGGGPASGNRLHIVALDAGVGIVTSARPKLPLGLPAAAVVAAVLEGALKGAAPGRGYGLPDVADLVDRYAKGVSDSPVPSHLFIAAGDSEKGELLITNWKGGAAESADVVPTSLRLGTVVWIQLPLAAERGQRSVRSPRRPGGRQPLPGLVRQE